MKTVKISERTHTRLKRLGVKGETFDEIIDKVLGETSFLPQLKALLTKAEADIEEGKQKGRMNLSFADGLLRFLRETVETIEAR